MAVRGRPTSSTPEDTVQALADKTHVSVPGQGDTKDNGIAGLGPLTGIVAGVGTGVLLGLVCAAGWPEPAVRHSRRHSAGARRSQRADDRARRH
jgi:hypothetical protein